MKQEPSTEVQRLREGLRDYIAENSTMAFAVEWQRTVDELIEAVRAEARANTPSAEVSSEGLARILAEYPLGPEEQELSDGELAYRQGWNRAITTAREELASQPSAVSDVGALQAWRDRWDSPRSVDDIPHLHVSPEEAMNMLADLGDDEPAVSDVGALTAYKALADAVIDWSNAPSTGPLNQGDIDLLDDLARFRVSLANSAAQDFMAEHDRQVVEPWREAVVALHARHHRHLNGQLCDAVNGLSDEIKQALWASIDSKDSAQEPGRG